jgi:glycerol-3-phosphate dehydrogenase
MKLKEKLFEENWNYQNRDAIIQQLKDTIYDVVIIGGGVTGAGVAREAALRGLKVALIDKQDFAAGTSSRSSKLAHGGFRYLTKGEFGLVRESTTERNWLRNHFPHNVRPLSFLFVTHEGGKYGKGIMRVGVWLYDLLSNTFSKFKNYKKHRFLKPEEFKEMESAYKSEKPVSGAAFFYDTNIDDARLTIESIKEAVIRGADAINYIEFKSFLKEEGRIVGIKCLDLENNGELEIYGKQVVNATGIWTDEIIEDYPEDVPKPVIRPTKGVHIQYPKENIQNINAFGLRSIDDSRVFFVLSRGDVNVIGTTDTDYKGDLANPYCTKEDADYLIRSVKAVFPGAKLDYEHIISTYAGARPLVMQKGKSESSVSRTHLIFWSKDGLLTITGGKLTTYRKMAEDLMKELEQRESFRGIKRKKNFSKQMFVIGLQREDWEKYLNETKPNLDQDILEHLYQQYGEGAKKIIDMQTNDSKLKERIIREHPFIVGEIMYILKNEQAPHLMDVVCRRTEMALRIHHKKQKTVAEKVADIMAKEYSWDEPQKKKEIKEYLDHIKKTIFF